MSHFFNVRSLVAVLALTSGLILSSSVNAGWSEHPRPRHTTVISYTTVRVPQTYYVTVLDHCGTPYKVERTTYRTVRVPVERAVSHHGYSRYGY